MAVEVPDLRAGERDAPDDRVESLHRGRVSYRVTDLEPVEDLHRPWAQHVGRGSADGLGAPLDEQVLDAAA